MKKIKGLNEEDIIKVVSKVAKNHRNKAFSYFTEEDIEQEVWIIVLNKLDEFTPKRGKNKDLKQCLENWLNLVVSRRLKNFYRDKFLVPQKALKADKSQFDQEKRVNLMHPIGIEEISSDNLAGLTLEMLNNDFWHEILYNLNNECIDILEAILSGQIIKSYYKHKLFMAINEIMEEKWQKENH